MTLFRVWQFPDLIDEVTNQKLTRPGMRRWFLSYDSPDPGGRAGGAQAPGMAPRRRMRRVMAGGFSGQPPVVLLSLKLGADPLKALVETFLDTWQFAATDPERVTRQHGGWRPCTAAKPRWAI